jgi:nitroreductase
MAVEVGLLEGLCTTRSIRRYLPEPVPPDALATMLFAATRAPSGSNRQPFRFLVLTDSERAARAKQCIGQAARKLWGEKRVADQYETGSGTQPDSPKSRLARTMQHYVEDFSTVPVLILACLVRHRPPGPHDGASIYPACQNLLLAARALGYGGVLTQWHVPVEDELRSLLGIPPDVLLAATMTLGRPQGSHGPVRRRPLSELVYADAWGQAPSWAVDPPGTRHTAARTPHPRCPSGSGQRTGWPIGGLRPELSLGRRPPNRSLVLGVREGDGAGG